MKIGAARLLAAIAATALSAAALAQAPAYPTRPLTLVVPYPAGGGNDVIARLVAAKMSQNLGQPIVIENRAGAGSTIGTRDVARAAPNGYTILIATSSLAINPSLYPDADYDPKKDFAPVGLIATSANLILVRPSLPAHSLAELIALAKAAPGKLNFASTGTGTSTHLAALLFAGMAGVTLTAIPYKGVAPAVTDLLGEHVDLMFCPTASVTGLVHDGKLRALAVTTAQPIAALPGVPTVGEFVKGYEASAWTGIGAPKGTPAAAIETLNKQINAGLADATIKQRFADIAADLPPPMTPVAFGKMMTDDAAKWSKVIKFAGIKPA